VAEYELHTRGISIPRTAADEAECSRWVQMGFNLFRGIKRLGYIAYPGEGESAHQFLEVYPHGAYTALLEHIPFPKHVLEGRIQRQLVLYLNQMKVSNPMYIFEEITRHRLLQGILPLDGLHTADELDALVAAYTAWLAATKPENVTLVGHAEEGQIVLPVAKLKSHYE
jgi:predicted RNase H-like nuclease